VQIKRDLFKNEAVLFSANLLGVVIDPYHVYLVPDGQTKYTKQKCKDGPKGACFELVNAAGQPQVSSHS
jgi:hypothetical protein